MDHHHGHTFVGQSFFYVVKESQSWLTALRPIPRAGPADRDGIRLAMIAHILADDLTLIWTLVCAKHAMSPGFIFSSKKLSGGV
jgi:hypothetical protein